MYYSSAHRSRQYRDHHQERSVLVRRLLGDLLSRAQRHGSGADKCAAGYRPGRPAGLYPGLVVDLEKI